MLEQLIKDNPKSMEALIQWVMQENQKQVEAIKRETTEDIVTEMSEQIAKELVEAIIKFNIRLLFNFFDEREIRIGIWYNQGWRHSVEHKNAEPWPQEMERLKWDTRIAAELVAFREAFDVLENQLNGK